MTEQLCPALKITACHMVFHYQKALLNGPHDRQYLDVTTTFTNFNSFSTFSKTIFAMLLKKQTKSTMGTLQRQLGIRIWSVTTLILEICNVEITVLMS